ncbi:hypothetical protein LTR95_000913 [Oleoguttula sp. CCFEE 5521]
MEHAMEVALAEEMELGQIEDFGKHRLAQFMRSRYNIVGREKLYAIARRDYPEVIEPRRQRAKRHRGKIIVPGPNYCLLMDGHCKLEKWGIQIYAAIDVYSRHIYIATARHNGTIPLRIRSDRGGETTLAAAAHFTLSKAARTKPDGTDLSIEDAFVPGTSKENVSIEMWWNQQTRATLGRWREFFDELSSTRLYIRDRLAHRLAFFAVYIPIIRTECLDFVDLWNYHRIRKQRGGHIVHGRPYQLYHYPQESGGVECSVPVDQALLDSMEGDVAGFELDEYLPANTKEWCDVALHFLGFDDLDGRQYTEDRQQRRHQLAYLQLRDAIQEHLDYGNEAALDECPGAASPNQFWRANALLREAMADLREANVAAGRPLDLDMDDYIAFREREANGEGDEAYARLRRELQQAANFNMDDNAVRRQQELELQMREAEDEAEVAVLWEQLQQYANDDNGPENIEGLLVDPAL